MFTFTGLSLLLSGHRALELKMIIQNFLIFNKSIKKRRRYSPCPSSCKFNSLPQPFVAFLLLSLLPIYCLSLAILSMKEKKSIHESKFILASVIFLQPWQKKQFLSINICYFSVLFSAILRFFESWGDSPTKKKKTKREREKAILRCLQNLWKFLHHWRGK